MALIDGSILSSNITRRYNQLLEQGNRLELYDVTQLSRGKKEAHRYSNFHLRPKME